MDQLTLFEAIWAAVAVNRWRIKMPPRSRMQD
jgi:hypothetical protein